MIFLSMTGSIILWGSFRLTKPEMKEIESQIRRLPNLPNWFVDIFPNSG